MPAYFATCELFAQSGASILFLKKWANKDPNAFKVKSLIFVTVVTPFMLSKNN